MPPRIRRQRRCTMAHLQYIMRKECFDAQFSLDSMDLFLSFLDEDIANEMGRSVLDGTVRDNWMEDPTFRDDYAYAIMSLAGTLKVVIGVNLIPSPTDRSLVRSKILSGIQGILSWILTMRRQRSLIRNDMKVGFMSYLRLVDALFDLHPTTRMTLLNTPLALDVVLFFWDAVDEDGQPFITYDPYKQPSTPEAAPTTSCIVLNLFASFLRIGRELKAKITMIERIEEGKASDPSTWAESAILRAKCVVQRLRDDPHQPNLAATTFLSTLAWGTGMLFVTASPRSARAVVEKKVYEELSGALHILSLRQSCPSTSPEILTEALLVRQWDMILWVATGHCNYVRGLSGMLEHGLLANVMRGAMIYPGSTPKVDQVKSSLRQLTFYSVYPSVLNQVITALDRLPPPLHSEILSREQLASLWNPFRETMKFYKEHLDSLSRKLSICDNLYHHEDNGRKRSFMGRICSRCKTFIYCSERCQAKDWALFHKEECLDARKAYGWRRKLSRHYKPSYRVFHHALIRTIYRDKWSFLESESRKLPPKFNHNPHDVLAVVNLAQDNPNRNVWLQRLPNPPPDQSDRRLTAIFKRHFDNSELRLVEATFISGKEDVCLLISLSPIGIDDGGIPEYEVMNSYARYEIPKTQS
ncbi:hypothetical protein BKA70DRAFT_1300420 [Coprinopsis sp. MPI-PUGE-AT-0042]|nr:hypothetical protein BKA70DRAFT_1300420 [Coprinopsis sp. MPI-PUGE-AT-0042]